MARLLIEADASKCEKLRALHEPLGNVCVEALVSCEDERGSSRPSWGSTAARGVLIW